MEAEKTSPSKCCSDCGGDATIGNKTVQDFIYFCQSHYIELKFNPKFEI